MVDMIDPNEIQQQVPVEKVPAQPAPVQNAPAQPAQPVQGQPQEQTIDSSDAFDKLNGSGEIELPEFDPKPYIGHESSIAFIEERVGQYGYYIKVFSQPVDEGQREIRASMVYGLQIDNDGKIGWGPKTQLGLFLKKCKVAHYRDLVANPQVQVLKDGKTNESYRKITGTPKVRIIIQTRMSKKDDGKEYLAF